MTPNGRNFIVGLVSIIALVAFATLLMLFGELDELRTKRYDVQIYMNSAGGLRTGSTVELDGVPVGRVESLILDPSPDRPGYPVHVVARIHETVRIPVTTQGAVDAQLIAGAAILQLRSTPAPPGETLRYHPKDGKAELLIDHRPLLEQIVSELDTRTEPLIRAMESFDELSHTYIEVGRNLNNLIAPQNAQTIADGDSPNLHAAVVRFHDIIDETQMTLQLAQNWLGDEQLRHEIRAAVINARQLIEDAAATLSQVGEFTSQLESRADDLVARLVPIADELAVIFEQVRMMTQAATEGEGTIAQLLNNPDLYNNLNDATIRLERALREIQLFIQKASAEGLPVRWF